MARLVLTDASPLIGLARVDGLAWLGALFGEVWLPVEVRREVLSGIATADERAIQGAERAGILRAWPEMSPSIPDLPDLDEGEAACIRLGFPSSTARADNLLNPCESRMRNWHYKALAEGVGRRNASKRSFCSVVMADSPEAECR